MTICIEVERGGIDEEDLVLHNNWDTMPTADEVAVYLGTQDIGYDPRYYGFVFYQVS